MEVRVLDHFNSQCWKRFEWGVLLSRCWFHRTWVLQEVILAGQDNVYLLCGQYTTNLAAVAYGLLAVDASQWGLSIVGEIMRVKKDQRYERYEPKIVKWLSEGHPYGMVMNCGGRQIQDSFYRLSGSVLRSTHFSDPRDQIYAILGFASELLELDTNTLPIDYTLSVREIYCRATRLIMQRSRSLAMLSRVGTRKASEHELPSWVPDYRDHDPRPANTITDRKANMYNGGFAASRSREYMPSLVDVKYDILELRGHPCDNVCSHQSLEGLTTSLSLVYNVMHFLSESSKRHNTTAR
jgi:hypothetical protein